jgi:hypothetical protein
MSRRREVSSWRDLWRRGPKSRHRHTQSARDERSMFHSPRGRPLEAFFRGTRTVRLVLASKGRAFDSPPRGTPHVVSGVCSYEVREGS